MKDLALFKLKLSISTPLHVSVCQVRPALFADRTFFAFNHNVQFNVLATAGVFPGVLTMFQIYLPPLLTFVSSAKVAFKAEQKATFRRRGERSVKVKLLCAKPILISVKLTNYYLFVATVSLVFQIAVLVMLIVGFELKRKFKFRQHAFIILFALILHIAALSVIMVPAYVLALIPITLKTPLSEWALLSSVHAAAGTVTVIMGLWIMATWRFRKSTEFCLPKKRVMRATFAVWVASLGLGVLLYLALNWSLLFG
jgi:hypothetical protein